MSCMYVPDMRMEDHLQCHALGKGPLLRIQAEHQLLSMFWLRLQLCLLIAGVVPLQSSTVSEPASKPLSTFWPPFALQSAPLAAFTPSTCASPRIEGSLFASSSGLCFWLIFPSPDANKRHPCSMACRSRHFSLYSTRARVGLKKLGASYVAHVEEAVRQRRNEGTRFRVANP